VQRGDRPAARAGHVAQRLVRLHLREQIKFIDRLTLGDAPFDQLGLFQAFAEVGKQKHVRIAADFACHGLVISRKNTRRKRRR
jgi:hypothetical protein